MCIQVSWDCVAHSSHVTLIRALDQVDVNIPSTPPCSLSGEVRERTIWAYWAQGLPILTPSDHAAKKSLQSVCAHDVANLHDLGHVRNRFFQESPQPRNGYLILPGEAMMQCQTFSSSAWRRGSGTTRIGMSACCPKQTSLTSCL
eukprot:2563388-Amphidinium_carterae.1